MRVNESIIFFIMFSTACIYQLTVTAATIQLSRLELRLMGIKCLLLSRAEHQSVAQCVGNESRKLSEPRDLASSDLMTTLTI